MKSLTNGQEMYALAGRLYPICRSITGEGVRETLKILQEYIPLTVQEVKSGTQAFDWTVPKEWNVKEAYIEDASGKRIVDFKNNALHIVSYSTPVNASMSLAELQEHLYSLPEHPDAVPYVTSYYVERWGFCLPHSLRQSLTEQEYKVVIDSEFKDGSLTYGELLIPGESKKEILLSTYICHPAMANNETSGPVLAAALAQWVMKEKRRYSYRIVFVPETIGAITYISRNLEALKSNTVAGYVVTCVGDERTYSFVPSRGGDTLADKVARRVLKRRHPEYTEYSFLDRGSDERQYCSPGVDLPVASIMRSKYGLYPEYHTSLDNMDMISASGFEGSLAVYRECLEMIEKTKRYRALQPCEPQLSRRGLYHTLLTGGQMPEEATQLVWQVLAYCDGEHDIADLSELLQVPAEELSPVMDVLIKAGLIAPVD